MTYTDVLIGSTVAGRSLMLYTCQHELEQTHNWFQTLGGLTKPDVGELSLICFAKTGHLPVIVIVDDRLHGNVSQEFG